MAGRGGSRPGTGGARAGAGRKPKRDKDPDAILAAEARIRSRLPELVDNMFILAEGVRVQEELPDGTPIIFTRPPDRQAITYLMDRVMGKPTERHENKNENHHSFDERFTAALARSYGRPDDYPNGEHAPLPANGRNRLPG
jgi:hypothetical protein